MVQLGLNTRTEIEAFNRQHGCWARIERTVDDEGNRVWAARLTDARADERRGMTFSALSYSASPQKLADAWQKAKAKWERR